MIDLRSDTLTRPTPDMLDAMMRATVGDDVFGEDPTVIELQLKAARLFGKEAAMFCPSGTMTNQIAIKVHTEPGDEIICHEMSHLYLWEGGGVAANSFVSVRLMKGDNGRFTAEQVRENINPRDDTHYPYTRLVAIENTVNKGGGACWDFDEMKRIRNVCDEHRLSLHLDGARLFNAMAARGESSTQFGEIFDTISICLSKGLGAPVGSLLVGSEKHIRKALRIRKRMGGGMRQAGYLAAAGIFALDNHVERLADDHRRAKALEKELLTLPYIDSVLPVETNIVIFKLVETDNVSTLLEWLVGKGIKASCYGPNTIRVVFHLEINDSDLADVIDGFRDYPSNTASNLEIAA